MKTRVIYNYKDMDVELGDRISALNLKLGLQDGETLQSKINSGVSVAVAVETAERESQVSAIQSALAQMQTEIEGAISTWFEEGEPDLENEPAVNWEEDEYPVHLGDLYYDTETGFCYRWQVNDSEYGWELVKDTDVTKAIADAADAKASALSAAEASVQKAQGAANAGHHLVVDENGNVTSQIPAGLLLSSADGFTTYYITVGEGGALTVNEVLADDGE